MARDTLGVVYRAGQKEAEGNVTPLSGWLTREVEAVKYEGQVLRTNYCHYQPPERHTQCPRGESGCECTCHERRTARD
jgi:O-succinylbenzoate synthase